MVHTCTRVATKKANNNPKSGCCAAWTIFKLNKFGCRLKETVCTHTEYWESQQQQQQQQLWLFSAYTRHDARIGFHLLYIHAEERICYYKHYIATGSGGCTLERHRSRNQTNQLLLKFATNIHYQQTTRFVSLCVHHGGEQKRIKKGYFDCENICAKKNPVYKIASIKTVDIANASQQQKKKLKERKTQNKWNKPTQQKVISTELKKLAKNSAK